MRTVWGVTRGEYSDYAVEFLFDSREEAERAAEQMRHSRSETINVEEFHLLSSASEVVVQTTFYVVVDADGREVHRWSYTNCGLGPLSEQETATRQHDGRYFGSSTRGYDVALKAARDRRAAQMAGEAGV